MKEAVDQNRVQNDDDEQHDNPHGHDVVEDKEDHGGGHDVCNKGDNGDDGVKGEDRDGVE